MHQKLYKNDSSSFVVSSDVLFFAVDLVSGVTGLPLWLGNVMSLPLGGWGSF